METTQTKQATQAIEFTANCDEPFIKGLSSILETYTKKHNISYEVFDGPVDSVDRRIVIHKNEFGYHEVTD